MKYYRQNWKTASNDNSEQINVGTAAACLEILLYNLQADKKKKWVHFTSLKVTKVDGCKIIVLCVCV
jgi:hypothetical protein